MLEMTEKQEFLVSCLQTALAQDPVVQPEHYGDTYSTEHVRSPGQGAFQPELLRHVSNMCDASFSGWLALGFKVSVCFFRCVWFWGCCPFRFFVAKESVYSLNPRPIKPPKMVVKILVVTGVLGRGTTEISPNMCLINT